MIELAWQRQNDGWTYADCPRVENAVYRFTVGGEVLYVGRAKHLWKRMRTHRKSLTAVASGTPITTRHANRYAPILSAAAQTGEFVVSVEVFDTWAEAVAREDQLIHELAPPANVWKSRRPVPSDTPS